jgi:CRP-like cAMP-binding protein
MSQTITPNNQEIVAKLKDAALFKGVEPTALDDLVKIMPHEIIPAGKVIFHKGDPGDTMYILSRGKMRIFTTDAGQNEIVLTYFEPVRVFGDFSLLDQQPRSASAAAVDEIDVLVLKRDVFLQFLPQHPSVGLAMLRNLSDRVRYITNYMNKIGDLTQRLSGGNYDQLIAEITESTSGADDSDIKGLINAFVKMVHSLKDREAQSKSASQE